MASQPKDNPSIVALGAPVDGNFDMKEVRKGFSFRMYQILERVGFARALGLSFDGKRDLWSAFGWDKQLNLPQLMDMYMRGGIAKRIIDAKPDSTWGRPPRIYLPTAQDQSAATPPLPTAPQPQQPTPTVNLAPPGTPPLPATLTPEAQWTTDFYKLAWDLDLWSALRKADILASLGRYSILLIGTNRGRLDMPLPRGGAGKLQVTFLRPYGEAQVQIKQWDADPNSPRFGLPQIYTIVNQSTVRQLQSTADIAPDVRPQGSSFDVHFEHVLHVAKGGLTNEVFGVPDYAPIWNYLTDLMKVVGGSSESYWRNAFPGIHANVDRDMDLDEEDENNLTAEFDEFQHDMRRILRTRGVDVKGIQVKIADPRAAYDVLVTLISGTTGIPKRILLGSESGQLASSQDKASWAERIEEYRETYAEPRLIWPFVMWAINFGVTPLPPGAEVQKIRALWPDAYRQSPLERGQTAAQTARSLANIQKGLQPIELVPAVDPIPGTPAVPASSDPITGETTPAVPAVAEVPGVPAVTAEPLINRDEARRILGLSTDQNLLAQFPEDLG
jgi:hypothetical protein